MNNTSKQELKATIAEQFKAMREYEAQVEGLWTRVAKLEAAVNEYLSRSEGEDPFEHGWSRDLFERVLNPFGRVSNPKC